MKFPRDAINYLRFLIRSGTPRVVSPRVVAKALEFAVKIRGKAFGCANLQTGDEMCINSDMSVACSCMDRDLSAILGNLKRDSFDDIFNGPTAGRFRSMLSEGRIPTLTCVFCGSLRIAGRDRIRNLPVPTPAPKSILVENTVLCNLRCATCPRDSLMKRDQFSMSLEDMSTVAELIRGHKIGTVNFLNWGEPFMNPLIYDQVKMLREVNPSAVIKTSTNGLLLDTDIKRDTALLMDVVSFSIFGASQKDVIRYQRGSNFEKAFSNMLALAEYRDKKGKISPTIEWKYVLFRWNDGEDQIGRAVAMAKNTTIDRLCFYPTAEPPSGISFRYFLSDHLRKAEQLEGNRPLIVTHPIITNVDRIV